MKRRLRPFEIVHATFVETRRLPIRPTFKQLRAAAQTLLTTSSPSAENITLNNTKSAFNRSATNTSLVCHMSLDGQEGIIDESH